jgi:hypothetical protein
MICTTATVDRFSSLSTLFSGKIALGIAAFALASGAAAWIADFDPVAGTSDSATPNDAYASSFDDRFQPGSVFNSPPTGFPLRSFGHSLPPELEIKLKQARSLLAQNLRSEDLRAAVVEEPAPSVVPVPKPRPVEASLALNNGTPIAQPDDRTLLQKLSDLFPARVTLASLAPDGGLFHDGPDLAALGYDNLTAVYDISARAVYMPNRAKLEAHSGMGALMDDPRYVSERNVGATPPNVYNLKPRERLFHGVKALRMIPQDDNGTLGRAGLLAHSYMLGPNGDSNGCVSIKNYDKFLRAFQNGEIKRLVVVASLNDAISASRKSVS